jgi:hypothetical protein
MEDKELQVPVGRKGGWVRIALTQAFSYLILNFSYEDAIKDILMKGGDTDTNCCI